MSHASSSLSSVFLDVAESDGGIYSCNLHHHYCHLYETVKIQLDVTKKGGCATAWGPSRQGAGSGSWSPVAPSTVLNSQWDLCAEPQKVLRAVLLLSERSSVGEGFCAGFSVQIQGAGATRVLRRLLGCFLFSNSSSFGILAKVCVFVNLPSFLASPKPCREAVNCLHQAAQLANCPLHAPAVKHPQ